MIDSCEGRGSPHLATGPHRLVHRDGVGHQGVGHPAIADAVRCVDVSLVAWPVSPRHTLPEPPWSLPEFLHVLQRQRERPCGGASATWPLNTQMTLTYGRRWKVTFVLLVSPLPRSRTSTCPRAFA
jgi:hypothetical protein